MATKKDIKTNTKEPLAVSLKVEKVAANLAKKDISKWKSAWQQALNIENPNRTALYDMYSECLIDTHLSGCLEQRRGFLKQKAFKLIEKDGKENKEITTIFESQWFKQFIDYCLESRYWGHSLIEFGNVIDVNGIKTFDYCDLIPRKNVVPEYGVIKRTQSEQASSGINYRLPEYSNFLIEVGDNYNLGLFLKTAIHVISKKFSTSFWDGFAELFGIPMRIAKTMSNDPAEIARLEAMLINMGAASWGLLPDGTTLDFKEASTSDSFLVFDKRIDRCNSEISKCILGQTMTTDNGSSQSQAEVHLEVLNNIIDSDADFIKDIVNNKLIPLLINRGFSLQNITFDWDYAETYSAEDMRQIEQMLLSAGYEIDQKYFAEKYNIPITGKRDISMLKATTDDSFFV